MNNFSAIIRQSYIMTISLMKARYRKTVAGFIWVLMNPIIMFGAQSIAFKKFLRLDIPNYHLFLTSNLIPWIFLISNLQMCTPIYEEKRSVLRSYQVNPVIFLLAQIFDNFFNFVCTFIILLTPLALFSDLNYLGIAHLVFALFFLLLGSLVISGITSFLQVFYKDIKFIVQFMTGVIFFVTPIFFPIEYVPENYRFLIELNIFYILIKPINICIYDFNFELFWLSISKAAFACTILSGFLYYSWRRRRNEFYLFL